MLAFLPIIAAISRVLGFVQFAMALEKQIEDNKKKQNEANIPVTDTEWTDAAKKGDL